MSRYVCIHGHFYQPPRENPWLEAVEVEDSAYPFHDWNRRITAECYGPNATSRILDGKGRIAKIVNNYARISFNFGPTLLSWLEVQEPEVYAAICEADALSRKRFAGHGSAMAQVYNHAIMPLCNRRDKVTQVRWGLQDFRRRFGRPPEGMWLAETAVDTETLEVLAEHGILFTVLAPHQARRVRARGEAWVDVAGGRVDGSRAYQAMLPSGRSIALFFYDGPTSRAVAFERLLANGELFANRLVRALGNRNGGRLEHIATDGETYGHHHPHGDMALAFALETIERDPSITLTNYGAYLAEHPPTYEVEIEERSSWSCSHGVERWRADCGCAIAPGRDWHQRWRKPLRDTLDWLRDCLAEIYEREAPPLLQDPWAARDAYIDVVLERTPERVAAFLAQHATRPLSGHEQSRVLALLEMQRHALLMFTSCGWFFDEISGLETVQILRYAGRALQLGAAAGGPQLQDELLRRLAEAPSNLREFGDGRRVYERKVLPARVDLPGVAAHFAVTSVFADGEPVPTVYAYDVRSKDHHLWTSGRRRLSVGRVQVTSITTADQADLSYAALHFGDHNVTAGVRAFADEAAYEAMVRDAGAAFNRADLAAVLHSLGESFGKLSYSMESLFKDEQRRILESVLAGILSEAEEMSRRLYDRHAPLVRYLANIQYPLPEPVHAATQFALNAQILRACERDPTDVEQIEALLAEADAARVRVDSAGISFALDAAIERLTAAWPKPDITVAELARADAIADLLKRPPLGGHLVRVQNRVYALVHEPLDQVLPAGEDPAAWAAALAALAQTLDLEVEHDAGRWRAGARA